MKNSIKQIKNKIKNNIVELLRPIVDFVKKCSEHSVSAYAAQSTLFLFISFFPFLMMLLSLLRYIPLPLTDAGNIQPGILPSAVSEYINTILNEITLLSSGAFISLTALTALWAASKGLYAVGNGLNNVYEVKETRNFIILRLFSLFETIAFLFLFLLILVILVFGNIINSWLQNISPLLGKMLNYILNIKGIGGLILLSLFFTSVYTFMPDRKCKFKSQLPGGFLTAAGWLIFSYLYSFYIDNFSNYSNIYGSLTAIVLFLLWLYFCMYMLFLGGEINCIINRHKQNGKVRFNLPKK